MTREQAAADLRLAVNLARSAPRSPENTERLCVAIELIADRIESKPALAEVSNVVHLHPAGHSIRVGLRGPRTVA